MTTYNKSMKLVLNHKETQKQLSEDMIYVTADMNRNYYKIF